MALTQVRTGGLTTDAVDNTILKLDDDYALTGTVTGAGAVVQVVTAKHDTAVTMTSTTAADTGLSAAITPTSSSNKILILVAQPVWIERSGGESMNGTWSLLRGSTVLTSQIMDIQSGLNNDSNRALGLNYVESYLDSPSTTSATTYKTQQKCGLSSASPQVTSQRGGSGFHATITLLEIVG